MCFPCDCLSLFYISSTPYPPGSQFTKKQKQGFFETESGMYHKKALAGMSFTAQQLQNGLFSTTLLPIQTMMIVPRVHQSFDPSR